MKKPIVALFLAIVFAIGITALAGTEDSCNIDSLGAQIRLEDPAALRFVFKAFDSIENKSEYGILVQPEVYLKGRELTHNCMDGTYQGAKDIKCEKIFAYDNTGFAYTVAIVGIVKENYARKYVAVPYRAIYKGENVSYVYGEAMSYSLYDIAVDINKKAFENGTKPSPFIEEIISTVHLDKHIPAEAVTENIVSGTCKTKGKYDEVVYCSVCWKELSRTQKESDYGDHEYEGANCKHCGEGEPCFIVDSVSAKAGESGVEVSISVENNPGVTSILLDLEYDDTVFTLKNLTYNKVIAGFPIGLEPNVAVRKSPAKVYWASHTVNMAKNTVIATLTFDVSQNARKDEYPLTVTYDPENVYNTDEENVSFGVINGKIVIE